MRTAGIICEYDPFHLGHCRQIELLRARGVDTVVCLMSGNTTQRGSFACADKYVRAEAAMSSGADLVLELPFPFCSASSEFFAGAGVSILDSLGVDEINFGSECADVKRLKDAATVICSQNFTDEYRSILQSSPEKGSAAAHYEAFLKLAGNEFPVGSNDILAVAYFAAAIRSRADAELTVVERLGACFNSGELKDGEYPSAGAIRATLANGKNERALSFMPPYAAEVFRNAIRTGDGISNTRKLDNVILAHFRLIDPDEAELFAESGDGVGRRLCRSAHRAVDIEEFYKLVSTKKYTDARLQRAVLFSLVGVRPKDLRETPKYTTILAANKKGRAFLSSRRKNSGIEIVTKPADAPESRQKTLSQRIDALFSLTMQKNESAENFMRRSPKISEND